MVLDGYVNLVLIAGRWLIEDILLLGNNSFYCKMDAHWTFQLYYMVNW